MANSNAWPALQDSQEQQHQTSTIVLLALLDEAHISGTFQRKLTNELKKNGLPEVKYEPEPGTATFMAKLMAGANHTEHNPLSYRSTTPLGHTPAHKSTIPLGHTPALHSPTVTKTSALQTLGATALAPQFRITSNQANFSKRGRTANSSMSLDDSTLQITSKKHKEDRQISLSQPQAHTPTTTANMGTLTPTETLLLRKSGRNEHYDYYQLTNPIELNSSSDEETSSNYASSSIDSQKLTSCYMFLFVWFRFIAIENTTSITKHPIKIPFYNTFMTNKADERHAGSGTTMPYTTVSPYTTTVSLHHHRVPMPPQSLHHLRVSTPLVTHSHIHSHTCIHIASPHYHSILQPILSNPHCLHTLHLQLLLIP